MAAYTLLQLLEVAVSAIVLLVGIFGRSVPVVLLGGGFLMAKAILNILWPEGGTVYRRSVIAYTIAGVFVVGAIVAYHFAV